MRSVESRSLSRSTTSSWTFSCTSRRLPAQHTWPWLKKMPLTMPSIAWSIGASSNTMFAALPPSSSVSFLPEPATSFAIARPTPVEPVKATLSTSGCEHQRRAGGAGARHDVDDAGRQVGLLQDLGEDQRRQRRRLGGLEDDGVAGRERGGDLPGEHQQREVPRDDLAGDAEGAGAGAEPGVVELVGPAGVVEEPRGDERDVDVAALLDRLAVVEALGHGELACALLHEPGDAEEVLAAVAAAHLRPGLVVGAASGGDGGVDIRLAGRGDRRDVRFVGGRDRGEALAGPLDELTVDEEAVLVAQVQDAARLGRGGVFEEAHGVRVLSRLSNRSSRSRRRSSAPVRSFWRCSSTSLSRLDAP